MLRLLLIVCLVPGLCALPISLGWAQEARAAVDPRELAAIRAELKSMTAQIESLREMVLIESTQPRDPALGGDTGAGSALLRLGFLEERLQQITGDIEQLRYEIGRVVDDATLRFGDIAFRITELEGGDVAALGDAPLLGGEAIAPETQPDQDQSAQATNNVAVAVTERSEYEAATAAFDAGDMRTAAAAFAQFNQTYPGSPYAAEVNYKRGMALKAVDQHKTAARAFLDAFTAEADGPFSGLALVGVGEALGSLGQKEQACNTLDEVLQRYGGQEAADRAQTARQSLGCAD